MRVLIDTTSIYLGRAGTDVYVRELLQALRKLGSTHEIKEFYCNVPYRGKNRWIKKAHAAHRDVIWQNVVLPRRLRKAGADLMHSPVLRTTLRADVPLAVTALDFYTLHDPKAFSRWTAIYNRQLYRVLKNAKVILSISEFTKEELLRFYPTVSEEKIFVTPLGVSSKFKVASSDATNNIRTKYNLERPFMLSVNTLEPRKNLPALIKAFENSMDQFDHDLVMIGSPGWIPHHLEGVMNSINSNPRIHYLGYVSANDLAPLYSAASFYVFPSLYEGFGLPVLEAMACGCPVLTAKCSSLTEVAGNAALFVDPKSIDDIARGLCEAASLSSEHRDSLVAKGFQRVKEFSWAKCAEQTIAAYDYAGKV